MCFLQNLLGSQYDNLILLPGTIPFLFLIRIEIVMELLLKWAKEMEKKKEKRVGSKFVELEWGIRSWGPLTKLYNNPNG